MSEIRCTRCDARVDASDAFFEDDGAICGGCHDRQTVQQLGEVPQFAQPEPKGFWERLFDAFLMQL